MSSGENLDCFACRCSLIVWLAVVLMSSMFLFACLSLSNSGVVLILLVDLVRRSIPHSSILAFG